MLLPYFASKEDDPESQPSGLTVLLKHKPLLVLALALAVFHLGNAAIVPLFRMSAVSGDEAMAQVSSRPSSSSLGASWSSLPLSPCRSRRSETTG
jgi:hypothetical protein